MAFNPKGSRSSSTSSARGLYTRIFSESLAAPEQADLVGWRNMQMRMDHLPMSNLVHHLSLYGIQSEKLKIKFNKFSARFKYENISESLAAPEQADLVDWSNMQMRMDHLPMSSLVHHLSLNGTNRKVLQDYLQCSFHQSDNEPPG